jgi:serine protease 16
MLTFHISFFSSFLGSYSGSLAAWARLKYPNLFAGSFATSAPVQAQLDFQQYFDVVSMSVGQSCSDNLAASTAALTNLLNTDRASLVTMFNLCGPIVSANDVANFLSTLSGPIAGIGQSLY